MLLVYYKILVKSHVETLRIEEIEETLTLLKRLWESLEALI